MRTMMKTFALACVILLLTHEGNAQCVTEDTALDVCLETAGLGDAAKEACDICVSAAAAATYAIGTTSCDELATPENGLCVALGLCPTCPVDCSAEMEAYALCEVNDELALECQTLACNVDGPPSEGTDSPPAGTDAPPEGTEGPPEGTEGPPEGTEAPPEGTDTPPEGTDTPPTGEGVGACSTEDTALDVCLETAGLGDAAKEACDTCVSAAAGATAAIGTTSCDELATPENGLCVALGLCPTCPVDCSAEMEAYALCEVNDELGLECQTLECNDVAGSETPTTAPAPTEAGGSTPTEASPTEDGSTPTMAPAPTEAGTSPTEAPPTGAGSAPTEESPTGTPTSMAASTTYTKIGAFVAGLLTVTALI